MGEKALGAVGVMSVIITLRNLLVFTPHPNPLPSRAEVRIREDFALAGLRLAGD
jgi:hypothetical protein